MRVGKIDLVGVCLISGLCAVTNPLVIDEQKAHRISSVHLQRHARRESEASLTGCKLSTNFKPCDLRTRYRSWLYSCAIRSKRLVSDPIDLRTEKRKSAVLAKL